MNTINAVTPSFGAKPATTTKTIKDTLKAVKELKPDNLQISLTNLEGSKGTIELSIPYRKLDKKGQKASENLILQLAKFGGDKKTAHSKSFYEKINEALAQINESMQQILPQK